MKTEGQNQNVDSQNVDSQQKSVYNHASEDVFESLGETKESVNDIYDRLKNLKNEMFEKHADENGDVNRSVFVEILENNFNKKELAIMLEDAFLKLQSNPFAALLGLD